MPNLSRREVLAALAGVPFARLTAATARPPVEVTAGPLRMIFEPDLALIRYVSLGDTEVVRGIFAPVRDRNWGTVEPRIKNLRTVNRGGTFRISFDVDCIANPIDFTWKGLITGLRDGTVKFTFTGRARSTFHRNRIGFCVLHPIDGVAGADCTVEHTGGAIEKGKFPELISPHQPFFDLRAITHTAAPGVDIEVRMEGDTFEMEDQRNWTDGSYKTYCTPLEKPFPVEVKAGTAIQQSVTIRVKGAAPKPAPRPASAPIRITFDETAKVPLPDIGLNLEASTPEPTAKETEWLRALAPGHLRSELRPSVDGWIQQAGRLILTSKSVNAYFQAAVLATTGDFGTEFARAGRFFRDNGAKPTRMLMMRDEEASTSMATFNAAEQRIGGLGMSLGAGTRANFTELNRNRPPVERCQFVAYAINPQVHAFDDASLVETLEIQAATLKTARSFSRNRPLVVAPVTLRQRYNPVATAESAPPPPDPRQKTRFGAAWTVGSIKYLAEGGAAAATYFELAGDGGIVAGDRACPAYHAFADVLEFRDGQVIPARSTRKLEVECLAVEKESRRRLIVVNFQTAEKQVELALDGKWSLRRLDASTEEAAAADPLAFRAASGVVVEASGGVLRLKIAPHAIVTLDRLG